MSIINKFRFYLFPLFYLILIVFISLLYIGCNNHAAPFADTVQHQFRIKDKTEFVIDSPLLSEFKANKFILVSHKLFDTTIGDPAYLYSWQERNSTKNEFTVIKDDRKFGKGLTIFYYILDKNDNLLSWKLVAGNGTEAIYKFETRSKFLNDDTLISIGSITQWYDLHNQQKMTKTKGDTIFRYFIIAKEGQIKEQLFKEVKDLHFK